MMYASTMQDSGADELTRLVLEEGFAAVRFNPYLWPEGKTMSDARGRAMFQRYCMLSGLSICNPHDLSCL